MGLSRKPRMRSTALTINRLLTDLPPCHETTPTIRRFRLWAVLCHPLRWPRQSVAYLRLARWRRVTITWLEKVRPPGPAMSSLTPRRVRNCRDFHFQPPRFRSPHRERRVLLRLRPRFPTSRGPTVRAKNLGLSTRSVTLQR